jgi:hypothetical protein
MEAHINRCLMDLDMLANISSSALKADLFYILLRRFTGCTMGCLDWLLSRLESPGVRDAVLGSPDIVCKVVKMLASSEYHVKSGPC